MLLTDPVILEVVFPGKEPNHRSVQIITNKKSVENYKGLDGYWRVWQKGTFESGRDNKYVSHLLDIGEGIGIYEDEFLPLLFSVENRQWVGSGRMDPESRIGRTRVYSYKRGYLLKRLTKKCDKYFREEK